MGGVHAHGADEEQQGDGTEGEGLEREAGDAPDVVEVVAD